MKNPIELDYNKKLGAIVKSQRIKLGMSQSDIGDKLGVTFQQVQKYERGINRISVATLAKLSDILGVQIWDLARDIEANVYTPPEYPMCNSIFKHLQKITPSQQMAVKFLLAEMAGGGVAA